MYIIRVWLIGHTLYFIWSLVMKIIALSDLHGNLIKVNDTCDVVVIAGDWSPLYCQHDYLSVLNWWDKRFIPWMKNLHTRHIVVIPGNHDLACVYKCFINDLYKIILRHNMKEKIHYLCYDSVIIDDKKFYGNPNSESPKGWAFSKPFNQSYFFDEDTDILVTHQPPMIGDVGYVSRYHREFGSFNLRDAIAKSHILLNICGHIHTGSHENHYIPLDCGNLAQVNNVAILDEDYQIAYTPAVIEI